MFQYAAFDLFALTTIVLFFLIGAEEVERGDAYVDKLLHHMFEERGEEYDPYRIEDSSIGFHRTIAFVNVSGEAKLYDGSIKGLKTLHRSDHCTLREEGDRLYVRADLGAGVLDFQYAGTVKFMTFGPSVSIEGELSYVEVVLEFSVRSKTGREGRLHKLVIDDMRGMRARINDLGPLKWALNPILSGATNLFKGFLQQLMEKKVRTHIANNLPNFQFPVEETPTDVPTVESEVPETRDPFDETEVPTTDNQVKETAAPEIEEHTEDLETDEPIQETELPLSEEPAKDSEDPAELA